jgi:hypothetical protein
VGDKSLELQRTTLLLLADRGTDHRIGRGHYYLGEALRMRFPSENPPSQDDVQQAFWSLISQGLAFIDMAESAPENWKLKLTAAGRAVLSDEDYNPDDASGYLERLASDVPGISGTTLSYVREAVRAYAAGLYLSATAMLGVASEAAMLEMAAKLAEYSGDQKLQQTIDDPRAAYNKTFQEVRRCLDGQKHGLPQELTDGMSLTFDSVLDLLRINRNDAGHPSGKHFDRSDCFISLRMAVRYLKKLYALNTFFVSAHLS